MKNTRLFIVLLLFNLTLMHAQREAANWYFGEFGGLDFNSGIPMGQLGNMATREGCASISNKNGMLLFYTNGKEVWGSNHNIMPNGYGLLGHNSSTQSAIIVPKPGNNSKYYVFTVDNAETLEANEIKQGLTYSEIDINLNNGLGDVIPSSKNRHLITYNSSNSLQKTWKCSEKIAAVISENERFYWVITHFVDTFYAFKINNNGVVETPITTKVNEVIDIVDVLRTGYGKNNLSALGYLKISPDGKKITIAHSSTANTKNSGKVYLYDFNNSTGKVSTSGQLLLSGTYPYGVEFSPKSKLLYISSNNYETIRGVTEFKNSQLYQYDLESSSIKSSKKNIDNSSGILAGALQLAIDGKIYRANYNQSNGKGANHLAVINKPEQLGSLCNYNENGVSLASGSFSTYGLPPFIASYFLFTFDYEFTCLGDSTHFYINTLETIDGVLWDFGDGSPPSTDLDTYHTYSSPGTYQVTLTKIVNGETKEPIIKEVVIKERPLILDSTFELTQCDSYDSNPNDAIGIFNLENSIDALTLDNANDFKVYFYLNDLDAENDTYNASPLPVIFTNSVPNQILSAKVIYKNSNCYSIGKVKLTAVSSILLSVDNIVSCDLGDNTAEFDLAAKKIKIINSLHLPNTILINFFDSEENAINNYAPLNDTYISATKEIYFKAENNGICYGNGKFNLEVNYFPPIDLTETIFVCENSFPIKINSSVPTDILENYTFNWSNGENTHEILVANEQIISVTITDKIFQCEKSKIFEIIKTTIPTILNIDINLNSNTVTVFTENNFDNLYSLDNPYDDYQFENTFFDVKPGTHTIYVKNTYNCGVSAKNIFVLGFPKFFTPNNDGINDSWEIKGLNFNDFKYSNIFIFNRYGKHLATMKPNSRWNGFYNGELLSSDDYWFSVNIIDSDNITKTYKGHFSLVSK